MIAMKCDICGKYYERYDEGYEFNSMTTKNQSFINREKHYDLCKECAEKLVIFIENGGNNEDSI